MARTLLLDLDGTLVDTVPDLAAALNRLMAARSLPAFTHAQVTRMVGDGVHVLLSRAFAVHGQQPDAGAIAAFMADYEAHVAVNSCLYPGVETVLAEMARHGWTLAVCTNKPEHAARALLTHLGLMKLLAAVGGGDSFPARKPDPAHPLATLARAGTRADQAVMLGDHRNDILCTRDTGIPTVFAAWGYGTPDMSAGAAAVAQTMQEAACIAERLRPEI